jgi:hypothetical protein
MFNSRRVDVRQRLRNSTERLHLNELPRHQECDANYDHRSRTSGCFCSLGHHRSAKENGSLPERINFAIPINEAQELLRKVIPNFTLSTRQEVLTDQQVFQSAKGSTVLIVADQDETGSTTYSENGDSGSLARFIAEFVRAGEIGSGEGQTDYYASPCDYFENGQCTRESIFRELQDYNHKWPSREYQLLGTPLVNVTNQGGAYEVSFKVSFTVRNRAKAVSGVCYFRAQVVRSQDGFLITAIQEKFAAEGSRD